MRVLCCLDGTNIEQISTTVTTMLHSENLSLALVYVIDHGPRGEMELQRERFFRSPTMKPRHKEQMQQAENATAQDILDEGTRYLSGATPSKREGNPEREIVRLAEEWSADLVVLCPRSIQSDGPSLGPKSVGHTARFVVDHAPCPVLLIRKQQRASV
ncbi:MAG: universal stress protein [Ktedonobacteraceae bacterium]